MRPVLIWLLAAACSGGADVERQAACQALDAVWSLDAIPAATPAGACTAPPPADLSGAAKIAVAVYHFNVQYVAGGLRGFPDGTIVEKFDSDETEVEDWIVRQGLEPVLDLYLAHPSFKADVELQAYTLEVIAQRHPDVLEKMRMLAGRGQVDFDSFHYSDQLYVAYPKKDLETSLDLVRAIFDRTCLPLGRSIFAQEGQFAGGQLAIAAARGYAVSVLPKNLFKYQFGDGAAAENVLFSDPRAPDHAVILGGQDWNTPDLQLHWTFMDDGEIAFSKSNLNPYFGTDYAVDPALIAERVAELSELEAQGWVHATIAEAVAAMRDRGIRPAPLPDVLDGTWQPKDTKNLFRWMGGSGLFRNTEKDSDLLAAIWRARSAAERAERSFSAPSERIRRGLEAAWREVLLAEVSDSTGWNPFVNEVRYSEAQAEKAEQIARDVYACAGDRAPAIEPYPCDVPDALDSIGAEVRSPVRHVEVSADRCLDFAGATVRRLTIRVPKTIEEDMLFDESEEAARERELEVRFPFAGPRFRLVPALEDRTIALSLDAYTFQDIGIPLSIGAIEPRRPALGDPGAGLRAGCGDPVEERGPRGGPLLGPHGLPGERLRATILRAGGRERRYCARLRAPDQPALLKNLTASMVSAIGMITSSSCSREASRRGGLSGVPSTMMKPRCSGKSGSSSGSGVIS